MFDINNKKYEPLGNKVKGKFITDLYMADKNSLYIFSEDQGLVSYNKEMQKVKKISLPDGIKVNKVVPDNERSLFLLTTSGIYALDIRTGETKKSFTNLKSDVGDLNVSDMYYSNKTGWLITTHNDGLYTYYDTGRVKHSISDAFQKSALLFDDLNTIFKDHTGVFWVGSQRGLSSFDPTYEGFFGIRVS